MSHLLKLRRKNRTACPEAKVFPGWRWGWCALWAMQYLLNTGWEVSLLQWGRDEDHDWRVKNLKSSALVAFTVLCTIDDVPVAAVEHCTSPQVLVFKLPPPPPPLAIVIAQLEQSGHNIHLVNLIQRNYNKTLIILPYIIMDTHLHTIIIRPVTITTGDCHTSHLRQRYTTNSRRKNKFTCSYH